MYFHTIIFPFMHTNCFYNWLNVIFSLVFSLNNRRKGMERTCALTAVRAYPSCTLHPRAGYVAPATSTGGRSCVLMRATLCLCEYSSVLKAVRSLLHERSTKLPTDHHLNSIIELSVCWCVWKVGEVFPCRV